MDIVRSNLVKLGGIIDLETKIGEGTKFSLRLPLTLAIIRGLLVRVAQVIYVVPLGSVIETLLIGSEEMQSVNGKEVVVIRGVTTPIVRLRSVFGNNLSTEEENAEHYVVVVGVAENRVGLVVDKLVGEQEVVIKSISRFCGELRGISGATILGNGNVALIVDVNGVLAKVGN
jgi:two-component system chemotaxis sensor kinase CheA